MHSEEEGRHTALRNTKKSLAIIFIFSIITRTLVAVIHETLWNIKDPFLVQLVLASLEPYLDYQYFYRRFAEAFISRQWVPYTFDVDDPILAAYAYPPLFLYVISIPAIISKDLVFIPLLLSDLALPFVIYYILREHDSRTARWGFLATILSPFLIAYNGGFFFNTSLVTLFLIISLYFIHRKQFDKGILFLAISFLFKQITLFLFIPILVYAILTSLGEKDRIGQYLKFALRYTGIFVITVFIGSLPWIVTCPSCYLNTLFRSKPTLSPKFIPPPINWPIHWYDFMITLGAPYWLVYAFGFMTFSSIGIILVEISSAGLLIYWHRKKLLSWRKFLNLTVYTFILIHLFFPRGVYKYYFTILVPLTVLWITFNFTYDISRHSKKFLLKFLIVSLAILFLHRLIYLLTIWTGLLYMIYIDLKKEAQEQIPFP